MSETTQRPTRVAGGAQPAPTTDNASNGTDATPRKRRARSPSVAKAAFIVVQIMDESGQPTTFDRKRIKVLKVERTAAVYEMLDDGDYPNAFVLKVTIPPGTREGVPNKAPTA